MSWRAAETDYDDAVVGRTTLSRLFEASADRHVDRPAQQYKGGVYDRSLVPDVVDAAPDGEFATLSYGEMRHIVRRLAAGFRALGVGADDRVGLFADTRMEWAQTDFALLAAGAVVTTVYPSSSERQVRYLLDDPDATAVVVENGDLLDRVLAAEAPSTASEPDAARDGGTAAADAPADGLDLDLDFVVVIDDVDASGMDDVYTLADVYALGEEAFDVAEYEGWLDARDPEDLASLIYTSGTTGRPKGVRLSHWNFRANVNQVRKRFGPRPDKGDLPVIDHHTRSLSFLPLAHVFERLSGHFFMFASGASVAYAESPDTLREDFGLVRPTTASSVPRVYEKLYDAIREEAESSAVGSRVFQWATGVGRACYEADDPGAGLRAQKWLADRLVFDRVHAALGGNVDFFVSGGGSLAADLCALYHGMGLPILEGYGLTETAPVVAVNPPEDPRVGTIGPPLPDVEVRLDASAASEGQRERVAGEVGELLVRGPNVTDGYWELPAATDRAFTDDGWFRTGDLVARGEDGYIQFVERVKEILTLSTGKNVAPGPIEDAFAARELVEQCMVVGDDRKFVSALLVPNADRVRRWADEAGIDLPADDAALCEDERVNERIAAVVDDVNEAFEPYEQIKQFRLVPVEFTEDNDLLTPTLKKKRRNVLEFYEDAVELMYAE